MKRRPLPIAFLLSLRLAQDKDVLHGPGTRKHTVPLCMSDAQHRIIGPFTEVTGEVMDGTATGREYFFRIAVA